MEINDEGAKPTELFSSCWSIDLHLTPFILLLLKICKEIGKSGLGEYRCRYTCTLCVITMHFPSGERERGGKRLAAYVDRMAHTHTHMKILNAREMFNEQPTKIYQDTHTSSQAPYKLQTHKKSDIVQPNTNALAYICCDRYNDQMITHTHTTKKNSERRKECRQ